MHLGQRVLDAHVHYTLDLEPAAFAALEPERARKAEALGEDRFAYASASRAMSAHFGQSVAEMGFDGQRLAVSAAGALLGYLTETQKNALGHILRAQPYESTRYLALGIVTPMLCALWLLWAAKIPSDYKTCQQVIRFTMIIGMLYSICVVRGL